jgi:membrane associated rhomboid family serine protease
LGVYFNFLSSMFMHGSIMHIFGNMMFLFIFGDNLENLLGHVRYAVFYIVCGLAAAAAQVLMDPNSIIPMLGASGAISGVLGGYILLFPQRQVRAIIFNFMTTVPAFVALGIWIVYQLITGYLAPAGAGGVAYAAHIGGFVAGLALVKVFALGRRV